MYIVRDVTIAATNGRHVVHVHGSVSSETTPLVAALLDSALEATMAEGTRARERERERERESFIRNYP